MKKECVIMKEEYKGFGTMAIHAGNFEKETFGALSMPLPLHREWELFHRLYGQ